MSGPLSSIEPFTSLANVTPNDSADLAYTCRGFYIAVAGNVKLTDREGNTDTYALGVGWHPIQASRIWATGTTATGLIAGW